MRDVGRDVNREKAQAVLGPWDDTAAHAGAAAVQDARLVALLARKFRGTLARTVSPLLLALAKRDLKGKNLPIPSITGRRALVPQESCCVRQGRLYPEDLALPATKSDEATALAWKLAPVASPGDAIFTKRFAVVGGDTMAFLWQTATQVAAHVRLDEKTRTIAPNALWLGENVSLDSLLVGIEAADRSHRRDVTTTPEEILEFALPGQEIHQPGGKDGQCSPVALVFRSE